MSTQHTPTDYKHILKYLKYQYKIQDLQGFPVEEMQSICKNTKYTLNTANGLTSAICDYITYRGGYANRINTVGIFNTKLGRRVKSQTLKGTPDIDGLLNAIPFKVEVKIGKDKVSTDQTKQHTAIVKAGGNIYIAKDFGGFYDWINELCSLPPIDIKRAKQVFK